MQIYYEFKNELRRHSTFFYKFYLVFKYYEDKNFLEMKYDIKGH